MSRLAELEQEEDDLRSQISALPDPERKRYYQQVKPLIRDPDTYAVLNYSIVAGLHHFYLGQWGRGILGLLVMTAGILLLFIEPLKYVGIGMLVLLVVIEVMELFRSQEIVLSYNNQMMKKTLEQIQGELPSASSRRPPPRQ